MHTGGHAQYLFEHLDRIRLARVDLHRLPNDAIAAASDNLYEMKVVGSDLLGFGGGAGRRRRRRGRLGQVDAVRGLLRCDRSGATVPEDLLHITRNLSGADECTFAFTVFTLYSNPCVQHVHHCPHCCVDVCIVCTDRCHGRGAAPAVGAPGSRHTLQ